MSLRTFALLWSSLVVGVAAAQTPGPDPSQALRVLVPNGHASTPGVSGLAPAGGMTFEFWAYLDPARAAATGTTQLPTAALRGGPGTNENYSFHCETAAGGLVVLRFRLLGPGGGETDRNLASSLAMLPNVWHHVAGTHDGITGRLYLDGQLVGSVPAVGSIVDSVAGALRFGSNPNAPNRAWNGDVDEARLWNYARSAAEIAADRFLRIDAAPGLVGAWHFDGDYDDSAGPYDLWFTTGVSLVPTASPVRPEVSLQGRNGVAVGASAPFEIATNLGVLPYLFDVGFAGAYPGIALPAPLSGILPINPPFLYSTYGAAFPLEWFSGFVGVTDAFGRATPTLTLPALPELLWTSFTGAAVLLDVGAPYGIRAVSNPATFVYAPPPPTLVSVSPVVLNGAAPSTVLTVVGSGFTSVAAVRLGLAFTSNVQVLSPTTLTCVAPPLGVGVYDLRVEVFGEVGATLTSAVTYAVAPAITAASLPYASAGSPMVVTGSGFVPNQSVTIGGVPAAFALFGTGSTAMFVTVPPGVPCSGPIVVTDLATGLSGSLPWNLPPYVSSLQFASGPSGGGGMFFVNGSTFLAGTTVTVGGAPATVVSTVTNQLQCLAPPGAVGSAPVVVTTPNGCPTTAATSYLYL